MKVLSILIPVYNEEKTIEQILKKVLDQPLHGWNKEIIVIDDGSNDSTYEKISAFKSRLTIIRHKANLGRGKAIRSGIAKATGDAVLFQDADLEYDPSDWPQLLNAYDNNSAIYGTRMLRKNKKGYMIYYLGNRLITQIANILFEANLTDIYTCYKLFDAKLIKSIPLKSNGFELEAEITASLLKRNIPIRDVPIGYSPRTFKEGKKIYYSDGLIGLWTLLRHRYS